MFEMECNVFKMKYTVELNSKLPVNLSISKKFILLNRGDLSRHKIIQ